MKTLNDTDKQMLRESHKNYGKTDFKGKVCLDLGANIGGFARIALDGGANSVVCVECDKRNFGLLEENIVDDRAQLILGAATMSQEYTIKIFKSNAKSSDASTSTFKRTRNFKPIYEVPNINFSSILDVMDFDMIKIDIEGGEYELFQDERLFSAKELFVEFHLNKSTRAMAADLMQRLKSTATKYVEKPIIYFKSVNGYDCYYRRY